MIWFHRSPNCHPLRETPKGTSEVAQVAERKKEKKRARGRGRRLIYGSLGALPRPLVFFFPRSLERRFRYEVLEQLNCSVFPKSHILTHLLTSRMKKKTSQQALDLVNSPVFTPALIILIILILSLFLWGDQLCQVQVT